MTDKVIRDLGEGIIIRHASLEDEQALVDFSIEVHSEGDWDGKGLEDWVRDLISGEGPTFIPVTLQSLKTRPMAKSSPAAV